MDGIQVEYSYPATPDVLWRALTERAKIAGWWGENDFVPEKSLGLFKRLVLHVSIGQTF